jgi:O-methyltransferase involved in polyketide biosynthesis
VTNSDLRLGCCRLAGGAEGQERPAPRGLDTSMPNAARIYDYLLGGKDNFQADRDAAWEILRQVPNSAVACRDNRAFLGRAVHYLAAEKGIRQFINIGCGLPTARNVHEIAQPASPGARVVYADYDPVVITHARAILEPRSSGLLAVEADLRAPGQITGDPGVRALIDFSQPVAILLFAVLHFLPGTDQPYEMARYLTHAMAPGSYLALSHITDEQVPQASSRAAQQVYQRASAPAVPRSRQAITRFFDGLELAVPGVADINLWPVRSARPATPLALYGGVARKP